jgi:hypothetical protein
MKAHLKTHTQTLPTYKTLGDTKAVEYTPLERQTWWMVTHFMGFFSGGTTFILGKVALRLGLGPPSDKPLTA